VTLANGLYPLDLVIGCPVTLRKNLDVRAGIVNGAKGIVVDIIECTKDTPGIILVDFEDYCGNVFVTSPKGKGLPIFRESGVEYNEIRRCYVEAFKFDIELQYAITIHRTQGLGLDKLAIFLGEEEMVNGLDFVAFSRVRKMEDICILDHNVSEKRIRFKSGKSWKIVQRSEEERLKELEVKFIAK